MEKGRIIDLWKTTWKDDVHTTEYALKRINSAKSAKLTPLLINEIDCYGYFQGSGGRYETFLNFCPCGDFRRSKLPCKHIYRLAIELGLMDVSAEHNIGAIVTPKKERVTLDETIDLVEGLSENAQFELKDIASNIRSTSPSILIPLNSITVELLNSGIIADLDPGKFKVLFKRKSDITELLDSENISYSKKATKNDLEKICMECMAEKAAEKFGKYIQVGIPTKFSSKKIHYYLHRKFDSEVYCDDDMNFYEIALLNTCLPDDDITGQLIKRGYYSRE